MGPAVSPVASVLEKYPSRINTINDTAEPATLLRNVLTAQYDQNAVVVLTGSATNLLSLLALRGASDLVAQKVKYLVAACTENSGRLFTDWPTPIVTIEPQAMSNIKFPATSIETDFAYNPKHPVADAYRAYQPMPYDAPTLDMAAVLYAGRPKGGYFQLSGSGKQRQSLTPDPAQADKIIAAFTPIGQCQASPARLPQTPGRRKCGRRKRKARFQAELKSEDHGQPIRRHLRVCLFILEARFLPGQTPRNQVTRVLQQSPELHVGNQLHLRSLPKLSTLTNWVNSTPARFVFCLKRPHAVDTHLGS